MKNKKLPVIFISGFIALAVIVGAVAGIFSQLEKYPIGENDTIVRQSSDDTLTFNKTEFRTGGIVSASDEKLKNCVLMLNDQRGIEEIYPSVYKPLFRKPDTKYYYRNSGHIICTETLIEKSMYQRTAYSDTTFTLPELRVENIRRINVCFGDYYDSTDKYVVDGVCDFFAATVDGNCPKFNIVKHAEIEDPTMISAFLNEFNSTGSLTNEYNTWCESTGRKNTFFQVFFADGDFPCTLLFTKEAINAQ